MGVELEEDTLSAMFAEADVDQSGKATPSAVSYHESCLCRGLQPHF